MSLTEAYYVEFIGLLPVRAYNMSHFVEPSFILAGILESLQSMARRSSARSD